MRTPKPRNSPHHAKTSRSGSGLSASTSLFVNLTRMNHPPVFGVSIAEATIRHMGEHTATRGNVKWAEDSGENEQMATQWNARKHRGTGSERDTHTCYPEPGRYWLHFASPGNCWVFGRSADVEESGPAPVYAVRKHRAPTRTSGRSRARGFPFTASTAVWGSVRLHFGDDPSGKNPANPGNPPRLRPDPNSENPRNPGNPRAPARDRKSTRLNSSHSQISYSLLFF